MLSISWNSFSLLLLFFCFSLAWRPVYDLRKRGVLHLRVLIVLDWLGVHAWAFSFFIDSLRKLLYRSHFETEMLPRNNSSQGSSACSLDANSIFFSLPNCQGDKMGTVSFLARSQNMSTVLYRMSKMQAHVSWKKRKMSLSMLIVYWGIFLKKSPFKW